MIKPWMLKRGGFALSDGIYSYRKSVTLSRASGSVSNYQMKLLVGESSGATGEAVDCGGKCLSTFNDLRFTNSDGTTLLDYWIESISGTTPNQLATVWIEFDSIGTGDTTFYMYYGKADATAVSSGANTFITFDDFDDSSVGAMWTTVGTVSESDTAVTITGQAGGSALYQTSAVNREQQRIRARVKIVSGKTTNLYNIVNLTYTTNFSDTAKGWRDHGANSAYSATKYIGYEKYGSETVTASAVSLDTNTYHIFETVRKLGGTLWLIDGTQYKSSNNDPGVNEYFFPLRTWGTSSSYALSCDWVTIGKCCDPEPSWGSWGAEEAA